MITREKAEFWFRHRSYPDIVDRGSPAERAVMTSEEWIEIEELVARLQLAARKLTSQEFNESTEAELRARTDSERVAHFLRWVASSPSEASAVGREPHMFGISIPLLLAGIALATGVAFVSARVFGSVGVGAAAGVIALAVLIGVPVALLVRSRRVV